MAERKLTIKMEQVENGAYSRESWHKLGPFRAKVGEDESLTIKVLDQEPEIVPPQEGQYGKYYIVSFLNSKAFADVYESKEYGTYMRLKLFDDVELPKEALTSMTRGSSNKSAKKATAPKPVNKDFWS